MSNWKSWFFSALVFVILGTAVVATNAIEFTAQGLFVFTVSLGICLQIAWDKLVLKNISTHEEIMKGNVAYAIVLAIPTLLVIAGAIAMQG